MFWKRRNHFGSLFFREIKFLSSNYLTIPEFSLLHNIDVRFIPEEFTDTCHLTILEFTLIYLTIAEKHDPISIISEAIEVPIITISKIITMLAANWSRFIKSSPIHAIIFMI